MNAPFWTDGGHVVPLLSDESITLKNIDFFDWEWGRVRWSRGKVKEHEAPAQ